MKREDILVTGQLFLFVLIGLGFFRLPDASSGMIKMGGLVVAVAGGLVGLAAIRQHQVVNQQPPKVSPVPNESVGLVESGLYQYVRHPIYSGVLLAALGAAIINGHLAMFVLFVLLYGWLTMKSMFEEHLLSQTYPTYPDYMTRTGRFIPPILNRK